MLPETLTAGQVLLCGVVAALVLALRVALAATGLWPTGIADPETLKRRGRRGRWGGHLRFGSDRGIGFHFDGGSDGGGGD